MMAAKVQAHRALDSTPRAERALRKMGRGAAQTPVTPLAPQTRLAPQTPAKGARAPSRASKSGIVPADPTATMNATSAWQQTQRPARSSRANRRATTVRIACRCTQDSTAAAERTASARAASLAACARASSSSPADLFGRFARLREQREPERLALREVRLSDRARERAHAQDVALTLSDADRATRIQHVECVRGFDDKVIRGQNQLFERVFIARQQALGLALVLVEGGEVRSCVGFFEIVGRPLPFGALVQFTERDVGVVFEVVHRVDVLQIHGDSAEAVSKLAAHGLAIEATGLLEVGELADLEAVQPHLPAEPPSAERRALPIVFDEAHVVLEGLGADRLQRLEVQVLNVDRARLQDDLELIELLQAVRVVTVTTVRGATRGFDVGRVPRFRTQRAQERSRVVRAGAHL